MDSTKASAFINQLWDTEVIPTLEQYIHIPNKSPAFDPKWQEHGHMDKAVELFAAWAREKLKEFDKATLDVVRLPGRTPLIFIEIPGATGDPSSRAAAAEGPSGATKKTVLMYGHLDKQPEMKGWITGPWEPVIKNGRLYGRGGADDGYALFAALSALLALKEQGVARARTVIIIEASEESGSPDLPAYIEHYSCRIGTPDLVVCLDSGCGNYEQLWLTTSLRGMVIGTLTVRVLTEGVHSGAASGIVPSSFRIARQLLSRIENVESGEITVPELKVVIPQERVTQAKAAADILGDTVITELPFAGGTQAMAASNSEAVLQKTWKAQMAVTALDGYPTPENGGNVLLPYTTLKLSIRVPPSGDAEAARQAVKRILETDPPYGAEVEFNAARGENGWNAPTLAPWLEAALDKASKSAFGKPVAFQGEGGSIPFMGMLGRRYPETQFVITGVLGPHSNAHGPNEFLDIGYAKKLSAAIASVLADHAGR
ncbi:MAG: M20/M25/M40 family metallo-hydrolase [Alphaproteobacteria bacterium]|nr:M20/M25/M40 family metallo-hydrolase [Alphaproteobacteria bacterium]